MAQGPQVIIVGAGILGLASAYHLLKSHPGLDLLVVERLGRFGAGRYGQKRRGFPGYVFFPGESSPQSGRHRFL